MAKRVPPNEKPYRPVEDALVRAVLNPEPPRPQPGSIAKEHLPSPPPRLVGIYSRKEPLAAVAEAAATPQPERLSCEKRVLLTPSEEWELEGLIRDMASQLRTPVKPSHVLRATVTLLRHASEELLKQSRRVGPLKRPPNNDPMALAAFEHYLAQLIDSALRNAPPLA
jgi:hypothetical protein